MKYINIRTYDFKGSIDMRSLFAFPGLCCLMKTMILTFFACDDYCDIQRYYNYRSIWNFLNIFHSKAMSCYFFLLGLLHVICTTFLLHNFNLLFTYSCQNRQRNRLYKK